MPNSRHIWVIGSPSRSRATKRRRSSITELALQGIDTSRPKAESVTHVSGTKCHLCLGSLTAQPSSPEQHRQPAGSAHRAFRPFHRRARVKVEFGDAFEPFLKRNLDLEPRKIRADAPVDAEPERRMPVLRAVEDHLIGVGEHRWVAI